jgi:O-antigen/teichoic acid export membrane protein
MLARLGLDQFGVWAVTGAIATYVYVLDFGIGRSLARFVAYYDGRREPQLVRECVGLGLVAVTAVGAAATAAAALAAPLVQDILGVLSVGEMRVVLLCSVSIATFQTYGTVVGAVPIGLRQMVPPSVASATSGLINFGFSVAALAVSTRLVDYAIANALAAVVAPGLFFISMRRVWKGPFVALPSRSLVREVLAYGVKAQVNWISELVNLQTDKIIIAVLLDVRVAGAYEIGSRVAIAIRQVGVLVLSAMIPTATAFIVERGKEVIPQFYRMYLRLTVGLAFPIFVAACVSSPFLLVAWLDEVPTDTGAVLVFLTVTSFANITTGLASTLSLAEGEAGLLAKYSALPAALNILLTLLLAPLFGLWGVLAGTVIGWGIGDLLFVRRFGQLHGIPFSDFVRAVAPAAALSLSLAVPFVVWYGLGGANVDERVPAAVGAVATASAYGLVYWVIASRFSLIPARLSLPWLRSKEAVGTSSS